MLGSTAAAATASNTRHRPIKPACRDLNMFHDNLKKTCVFLGPVLAIPVAS